MELMGKLTKKQLDEVFDLGMADIEMENVGRLVDCLISECIKLGVFESILANESRKENPDLNKFPVWAKASREANEARAHYRIAIDQRLKKAFLENKYKPVPESRTMKD